MNRIATGRFDIKAIDDSGTFSGWGSVFDVVDYYGDVVKSGAFSRTLAEHEQRQEMPMMLREHDNRNVIGVWTHMSEDDRGLYVEGQLLVNANVPLADETYSLAKAGALRGLSIGFIPRKHEIDRAKKVRNITDVDLFEVSIVAFPANRDASVSIVKSFQEEDADAAIAAARQLMRRIKEAK